MKTIKKLKLIVIALIIIPYSLCAQEGDPQMYWVHEDHVNPGMISEHDNADKNFITEIKNSGVQTNWLTVVSESGVYRYLQPIKNMAEIDNNFFTEMSAKVGEAKMKSIMDKYKDTYSRHGDYIISLHPNLSYDPTGINPNPEGEKYRRLTYYYPKPGKNDAFLEKAKAIKEMFKAKSPDLHYRVYHSGFGTMDNYYMVAIAAKDAADYDRKLDEASEVLGQDFGPLINELQKLCSEITTEHVWIRDDLSIASN